MEFVCKRCDYKTDQKCILKRHLEKKYICNAVNQDIPREDLLKELNIRVINDNDKTFTCVCGKKYKQSSALTRHRKSCVHKPQETPELLKIVQNLQEEIERLKRDPKIINNTTNNITNNNLILNDFGKENIEYITEAFVRTCLKQQDSGFIKLTEKIHFNDDHPENKNLILPNKREPYIQIVENGKKILKPKKEVLDELIANIGNILDEQLDCVVDELKKNWVKNEHMALQLERFIKNLFDEESSLRKRLNERVYLLLINNRGSVI